MQPSDSLPPVGRGSGRPWPVAYPVPRATRRKKGLPGAWAVLFQRAVGSDPAGCASRLAHRVETAIAFRLHNALGTQNERYFVAVHPTAHSLACLRIGVFVTADAARLATGVGGSPFTGRVSHPLDGKQSFMTSPHRHSPLTSLAWSHHAPTPLESINALIEERCAKVDHWQNSSQRQRWLATALLDIEPRLRKVMGYRHLPRLRDALKRELKIDTTTSKTKAA